MIKNGLTNNKDNRIFLNTNLFKQSIDFEFDITSRVFC